MGWTGKKNGELIQAMAGQKLEVLLTVDQNIRHQQNMGAIGVALMVLVASSNRLANLKPLIPSVLSALNSIKPGDIVEITK